MSTRISNQDENKLCTTSKYIVVICGVILVSFGIKIQSWDGQHDIYQNLYIVILSCIALFYLLFLWIDLQLIKSQLLKDPSNVNRSKLTSYTYLKAAHSYSFYLKVGLSIFCFVHLILTTTLISQEYYYYSIGSQCFNQRRTISSFIDLLSSLGQLLFILHHSNIIINRFKTVSHVGCMLLITVALLKWFSTIAAEADFTISESKLKPHSSKMTHIREHSYQSCANGTVYHLPISNFLPYIDPFTIEFNFLLAIQWLIIWQHIGHFKQTRASSYWSIAEPHETVNEIDELAESIVLHKSGRGLLAGIFCFIGSLVSLIYYFSAVSNPDLSEAAVMFTKWEDFVYLASSLFSLLIVSFQLTRLGNSTESCIGSTDMMLLITPLIAFFIRGYIEVFDFYSNQANLLDQMVEILGIIQPLGQTIFIYYARSKRCTTHYLSEHKPGRQIITLLIALNLVLWVSGAFRAKAKPKDHDISHIFHAILLDICQPFILFYRYHASVCLANIWKIVYSPV